MFWYTESAVPWNQSPPRIICGGTTVTNSSLRIGETIQALRTCSISDCDLYWTSR